MILIEFGISFSDSFAVNKVSVRLDASPRLVVGGASSIIIDL
jgi:hypothetical protein